MRIVIKVLGKKGDYWRYTIHSWILEIKDIIENEYNVKIEVEEVDADFDLPVVMIENEVVCVGIPGEEGYLLEVLKEALDRILSKS